jgi:N utilization substance protein B
LLKLWIDTTTDPPEGEKDFFGEEIPMGKRRKARELVLQSLYSYEIKAGDAEENLQDFFSKADLDPQAKIFAAKLYHKVIDNLKDIDSMIKSCVKHWDLSRISVVDKNILRMGICEFLFFEDIPKKVSLDEAIELAKKYGGEDSGSFVNGILDAIAQSINAR